MPSSGCQKCALDRKSTRLNSSHTIISYAVFCLKKDHTAHQARDADDALGAAVLGGLDDLLPHRDAADGVRSLLLILCHFFFNDRGPTKLNPLPHHAPSEV